MHISNFFFPPPCLPLSILSYSSRSIFIYLHAVQRALISLFTFLFIVAFDWILFHLFCSLLLSTTSQPWSFHRLFAFFLLWSFSRTPKLVYLRIVNGFIHLWKSYLPLILIAMILFSLTQYFNLLAFQSLFGLSLTSLLSHPITGLWFRASIEEPIFHPLIHLFPFETLDVKQQNLLKRNFLISISLLAFFKSSIVTSLFLFLLSIVFIVPFAVKLQYLS